jgi:hypothetical protein
VVSRMIDENSFTFFWIRGKTIAVNQRARGVLAITLQLGFLLIVGVRAVITAVCIES